MELVQKQIMQYVAEAFKSFKSNELDNYEITIKEKEEKSPIDDVIGKDSDEKDEDKEKEFEDF